MTEAGWRERARYAFDKTMAKGPIALIGWLALATLAIMLTATLFLMATGIAPEGSEPQGFAEEFWAAGMRALDAGAVGGDSGWPYRITMLLVTLAGLFIVSALIGVLSSGLDAKLETLRKGRSTVLESDHTIIYNWSPSIFDVISELVVANESRTRPRIVIMSVRDKVEMEDAIADKIGDLKNTRIICRSGDPTDLFDIGIANPATSRSIIILSPEDGDDPDSQVIKTILALVSGPDRRAEPYRIAAEIRDEANAEVARVVGGKEVQLVLADDLISRVMVQSTRQPGLSAVFTELLDFDGCEIYTAAQPALAGKSFSEAVLAYDTSSLIGLCRPDGTVMLNPPVDMVIGDDMQAIIIAEDDDRISMADAPAGLDWQQQVKGAPCEGAAERTLLLGWNRRAPLIVTELSRYVGAGSLLTIAADLPDLEETAAGLTLVGDRMQVETRCVDITRYDAVAALNPGRYDHILVLGYSDTLAAQAADTRTLVALLHLRRIAEQEGRSSSIVSEMIDVRNRELARVTRVEDFVVSNKLVSLMLAQASENPFLEAIFADLLDEDGSEVCLKPAELYVPLNQDVPFYAVAAAALARGEVAIGHNRQGEQDDSGRGMGGIDINPAKSARVRYQAGDRIVVLARG